MPRGGRPLVMVNAIPAAMIFRTALRARGVMTLSGVTSAPSTSATTRRTFSDASSFLLANESPSHEWSLLWITSGFSAACQAALTPLVVFLPTLGKMTSQMVGRVAFNQIPRFFLRGTNRIALEGDGRGDLLLDRPRTWPATELDVRKLEWAKQIASTTRKIRDFTSHNVASTA